MPRAGFTVKLLWLQTYHHCIFVMAILQVKISANYSYLLVQALIVNRSSVHKITTPPPLMDLTLNLYIRNVKL